MDTTFLVINSGFYDYDLSEYLVQIRHAYIKYFIGGDEPAKDKILHIVCRQHQQEEVLKEIKEAFPFDETHHPHLYWSETQILIRRDHHAKFYAFFNIGTDKETKP